MECGQKKNQLGVIGLVLSNTPNCLTHGFRDSINFIGILTTTAEVVLAIFLLIGFKTSLSGKLSGFLLLIFGVAMTITTGIKAPLDYSVFSAAAAGFGLSLIDEKYLEIDLLFDKKRSN